jgi:hypothetical protein
MAAMVESSAGEGRHRVCLALWNTGNGWIGSVTGGDAPHVGGVVLAVPRPSLTGGGQSCDLWAIPVPGHLDHEVASSMARELCVRLGAAVSLTAGIHIEQASPEDIRQIRENCATALDQFPFNDCAPRSR